jgi:hypothetical protein
MTLLNINLMTAIIYLTVFSQILTISIIYANKWYKRKYFLLKEYPPIDYPNLYAQDSTIEFNRIKIRKLIDRSIAVLSLSLMLFFYFTKVDIETVASSILVLAAIQLLPWTLSTYWNKENNLLMAKNFPSSKRKSSFSNRQITDFVTPNKLVLAILSYGVTLFFTLYIFFEKLWFDNSNKALLLLLLNTLMICYLAWLLFNSLYGKKKDHFISSDDRLKIIAEKCKALTSFLIMYSVFITGICLIRTFDLNQIYVSAMTGVFIQLMFVLSFTNSVKINYDVYK